MSRLAWRVIVGATYWTLNGVNVFSANLVRGLRARGIEAEILLTEQDTERITITDAAMARPADVPMATLPVERWHSWGAHWGAMVRYLEDRAPCVYIPNSDWRHSCVCPLLSDDVRVAGVVHSDDPMHYDHVRRLGRYWNAIVTTSPAIRRKTLAIDPAYADRTQVIPIGVDIPSHPPRREPIDGAPLRVIYAGMLKQHQKRIFDLPKIIDAAVRRGLTLSVTIAGSGPQEDELRQACEPFVRQGIVHFAGLVEHSRLLALLETHDVFIMMSEFEGMPNALLEAMGRGVVPLVTDIESGIADVVRDGRNGHAVPVGDVVAFAERLEHLSRDSAHRRDAAALAYETVVNGKFRIADMVDAYARLCSDLIAPSGRVAFQRPRGTLSHPPREIDGIGLFPVDLEYEVPGVGAFPRWLPDYREFSDEILAMRRPERSPVYSLIAPAPHRGALHELQVVMSWPQRTANAADSHAVRLTRDLIGHGIKTHLLITEEDTDLVAITEPLAASRYDVPCVRLPVERKTGWGGHWGATVRHLESHAPCIYVPNHDWRHACVSPVLPDRVGVVAIVGDDPGDIAQARRLGRYWNALVTRDAGVAALLARDPELAPRIVVVPTPAHRAGPDFAAVCAKVLDDIRSGAFRRPAGTLQPPPRRVGDQQIFADERFAMARDDHPNCDGPQFIRALREFEEHRHPGSPPENLLVTNDVPVIVASPSWEPSGVNDWCATLVRELAASGVAARLLLTEEDTDLVPQRQPRPPLPADLPIDRLHVPREAGWGARWGAMLRYLEDRAPCIYIPNHDWRHSCICPLLSDAVMVVGVLHDDDSLYADLLTRLGPYWNAVVAYHASAALSAAANPSVASRVYLFPYSRDGVAPDFIYLFNTVLRQGRSGVYRRPRGILQPPPAAVSGIDIFTVDLTHHERGVGVFPRSEDYAAFVRQVSAGSKPSLSQ